MKKQKLYNAIKKITRLVAWTGGLVGFVVIMIAAVGQQRRVTCTEVGIHINDRTGLFFIDETDVKKVFKDLCGDHLEGTPIKMIDLNMLENALRKNPFVKNAEVYAGTNGELHVTIDMKRPILRVINSNGVSYYITENAELMPVSDKFTSRVPVATGNVGSTVSNQPETVDSISLAQLYQLGRFVDQNPFWSALVEQIHVNKAGDFEIVPMVGSHTILIGDAENLESKFKRLMIFYKEVLKNVDEETYKTINVQYNNQIICTKHF